MIHLERPLFDFDFGGSEHGAGQGGGQIDLGSLPAFVAQQTAGGFPVGGHVADQLDRTLGDAFGFGVGALDAVDDGLELQIAFERLLRLRLDIAHGRSDLFIRVGGDVFHQEIHQARVALQ